MRVRVSRVYQCLAVTAALFLLWSGQLYVGNRVRLHRQQALIDDFARGLHAHTPVAPLLKRAACQDAVSQRLARLGVAPPPGARDAALCVRTPIAGLCSADALAAVGAALPLRDEQEREDDPTGMTVAAKSTVTIGSLDDDGAAAVSAAADGGRLHRGGILVTVVARDAAGRRRDNYDDVVFVRIQSDSVTLRVAAEPQCAGVYAAAIPLQAAGGRYSVEVDLAGTNMRCCSRRVVNGAPLALDTHVAAALSSAQQREYARAANAAQAPWWQAARAADRVGVGWRGPADGAAAAAGGSDDSLWSGRAHAQCLPQTDIRIGMYRGHVRVAEPLVAAGDAAAAAGAAAVAGRAAAEAVAAAGADDEYERITMPRCRSAYNGAAAAATRKRAADEAGAPPPPPAEAAPLPSDAMFRGYYKRTSSAATPLAPAGGGAAPAEGGAAPAHTPFSPAPAPTRVWRPFSCRLPVLRRRELLHALNGRWLFFLGDSTTEELANNLLSMMSVDWRPEWADAVEYWRSDFDDGCPARNHARSFDSGWLYLRTGAQPGADGASDRASNARVVVRVRITHIWAGAPHRCDNHRGLASFRDARFAGLLALWRDRLTDAHGRHHASNARFERHLALRSRVRPRHGFASFADRVGDDEDTAPRWKADGSVDHVFGRNYGVQRVSVVFGSLFHDLLSQASFDMDSTEILHYMGRADPRGAAPPRPPFERHPVASIARLLATVTPEQDAATTALAAPPVLPGPGGDDEAAAPVPEGGPPSALGPGFGRPLGSSSAAGGAPPPSEQEVMYAELVRTRGRLPIRYFPEAVAQARWARLWAKYAAGAFSTTPFHLAHYAHRMREVLASLVGWEVPLVFKTAPPKSGPFDCMFAGFRPGLSDAMVHEANAQAAAAARALGAVVLDHEALMQALPSLTDGHHCLPKERRLAAANGPVPAPCRATANALVYLLAERDPAPFLGV